MQKGKILVVITVTIFLSLANILKAKENWYNGLYIGMGIDKGLDNIYRVEQLSFNNNAFRIFTGYSFKYLDIQVNYKNALEQNQEVFKIPRVSVIANDFNAFSIEVKPYFYKTNNYALYGILGFEFMQYLSPYEALDISSGSVNPKVIKKLETQMYYYTLGLGSSLKLLEGKKVTTFLMLEYSFNIAGKYRYKASNTIAKNNSNLFVGFNFKL